MTGLQTNVGLISGINYVELVQKLIEVDRIPQTNLLDRTEVLQKEKTALTNLTSYFSISSSMLKSLNSATPFKQTSLTSSNESLVKATTSGSVPTPVGTYTFTPMQMASAQQTVAKGVASDKTALGKTGTITIGKGWDVENEVALSDLNGGEGFVKGSIRITDGNGIRTTVDLKKAITVNDVIDTINNNDDIDVVAELDGDHIVLRDVSGGDPSKFTVAEVSGGKTAASLGFIGQKADATSGEITGNSIYRLGEGMNLSLLNDGNGVVFDSTLDDITVICKDGSKVIIDFSRLSTQEEREAGAAQNQKEITIGDLLNTINNAADNNGNKGKLKARISDDGKGFVIEDTTKSSGMGTGMTTIEQTSLSNPVLQSLGFAGSDYIPLQKVSFLSDIASARENATMTITDKAGNSTVVELQDADLIDLAKIGNSINAQLTAAGVGVQMSYDSAANSYELTDTSGGGGSIAITDTAGCGLASRLGLTNLSQTTPFSNALAGAAPGSIDTTDREGKASRLTFSQADLNALTSFQDAADMINKKIDETRIAQAATPGKLKFTDREGHAAEIEITQAELDSLSTVQDAADLFTAKLTAFNADPANAGNEVDITVSLDSHGGLTITDTTNPAGTGNLKIEQTVSADSTKKTITSFFGIEVETSGQGVQGTALGSLKGADVRAEVNATGDGINIVDTSGGTGDLSFYSLTAGSNTVPERLGISGTVSADTISGTAFAASSSNMSGTAINSGVFQSRNVLGGLDTILTSTLNGGKGLSTAEAGGAVEVQDRSGKKATLVFSKEELNSMQTLNDAVKMYNKKLTDAGVNITVQLNNTKTALQVVDNSGKTTHNLIFKDGTEDVLVPEVPARDAQSAGANITARSGSSGTGLGGTCVLEFDNTSAMNGMTFAFTKDSSQAGYNTGTQTFTFYLDETSIKASINPHLAVQTAINDQIAGEWNAINRTVPVPTVKYRVGMATQALADAGTGAKTAITNAAGGTMGMKEGTALLTFEDTGALNNVTFAFTTDGSKSGYDAANKKLTVFLSSAIATETDAAAQDQMVKEAIDNAITGRWSAIGSGTSETTAPAVTLTAGMGAQAVADAASGGETRITGNFAGGIEGQTHVPEHTIAVASNIASSLGLSVDSATSTVNGSSLHRQIISHSTQLSELNGGSGVALTGGSFTITDSASKSVQFTINATNHGTVGDVINLINNSSVGVHARINDNGDGILLEDVAGGTGTFSVTDGAKSTFAATLGIAGSVSQEDKDADGRMAINASQTHEIEVEATDTLEDIRKKINDLNKGYTASILVDGTDTPYRLSVSSTTTGAAGGFNIDLSTLGLTTETMSESQDAIITYGGTEGLVLHSKTNSFKGIISGMDLTISGTSDTPVTINSAKTGANVKVALELFVENYNTFRTFLNKQMNYTIGSDGQILVDPEEGMGMLWNSSIARSFDREVSNLLLTMVDGDVSTLANLGITMRQNLADVEEGVGANSYTGHLSFDADTFQAAWDANPEAVEKFFFNEREYPQSDGTTKKTNYGFAQKFTDLTSSLIGSGAILGKTQARIDQITTTVERNMERANYLEERLAWKEQYYLKQFYAMEQAMAKMQGSMDSISSLASTWSSNYSSTGA